MEAARARATALLGAAEREVKLGDGLGGKARLDPGVQTMGSPSQTGASGSEHTGVKSPELAAAELRVAKAYEGLSMAQQAKGWMDEP